jgi:hypothetical protein
MSDRKARMTTAVAAPNPLYIEPEPPTVPDIETPPVPRIDHTPKRNARYSETKTVHRFPGLLPFGLVVMTVSRDRWWIKCGSCRMHGWGGTVDEVVKAFVKKVKDQANDAATEVGQDDFTTEDKAAH